jgi:ABC-type Zn uptake system ZnuABC Zn-binding protein ZnuA
LAAPINQISVFLRRCGIIENGFHFQENTVLRKMLPILIILTLLTACRATTSTGQPLRALAVETFMADIAQNVAGDRLKVESLMPLGADPHSFEPTPRDVARVADSPILIVNGAGYEAFLDRLLQNAGGQRTLIVASTGLAQRNPSNGNTDASHTAPEEDPHFWLNPINVIQYVENIRDGLIQADPAGKDLYMRNAQTYVAQLNDLDTWMAAQVANIPVDRRLLVTNHESLGYFADRYGFIVIGAIVPNVSSMASPSAQQLAALIDQIKVTGAPAIFLETGTNTQMAQQIAKETGIQVVNDLYTESLSATDGPAPTYLELMRYDMRRIVTALK